MYPFIQSSFAHRCVTFPLCCICYRLFTYIVCCSIVGLYHSLSILLLMGIWVTFSYWPLRIVLQCVFYQNFMSHNLCDKIRLVQVYNSVCRFAFSGHFINRFVHTICVFCFCASVFTQPNIFEINPRCSMYRYFYSCVWKYTI